MARTAVLTKDQILEAAFNLMNSSGAESITIRSIAKALNKSTAPIYTQYPSHEAIMTDLEIYVGHQLEKNIQTPRTIDGFKNIGLGILDFALSYKAAFDYYYLTTKKTQNFFPTDKDMLLNQMKANDMLTVLDDDQLLQLLDDMWVYTYGLATMICTGIETSDSLDYYSDKLGQMGHKTISYYLYSTGKYDAYLQKFIGKVAKHIDLEEVLRS